MTAVFIRACKRQKLGLYLHFANFLFQLTIELHLCPFVLGISNQFVDNKLSLGVLCFVMFISKDYHNQT